VARARGLRSSAIGGSGAPSSSAVRLLVRKCAFYLGQLFGARTVASVSTAYSPGTFGALVT